MDPHFDKQEPDRRPLLSTEAACWLSVGAVSCALCWLASVQPDAAIRLSGGMGLTIVAAIIVLKSMRS